MRLTLRTMLAYLDDLLEPADAEEIGARIRDNEAASQLASRICDVTRRLRLGTPKVSGRGGGANPNTVAEYLDNTLSTERVPEFERACLESDVQLAEVAACHQVLTLVLGEPAEVTPDSRQRMYKLLGSRRVAVDGKHLSGAGHDDDHDAIHDGTSDEALTADTLSGRADKSQAKRRKRPEVPDYLREPDERPRRRWPLVGVLALAAIVAVVALVGTGQLPWLDLDGNSTQLADADNANADSANTFMANADMANADTANTGAADAHTDDAQTDDTLISDTATSDTTTTDAAASVPDPAELGSGETQPAQSQAPSPAGQTPAAPPGAHEPARDVSPPMIDDRPPVPPSDVVAPPTNDGATPVAGPDAASQAPVPTNPAVDEVADNATSDNAAGDTNSGGNQPSGNTSSELSAAPPAVPVATATAATDAAHAASAKLSQPESITGLFGPSAPKPAPESVDDFPLLDADLMPVGPGTPDQTAANSNDTSAGAATANESIAANPLPPGDAGAVPPAGAGDESTAAEHTAPGTATAAAPRPVRPASVGSFPTTPNCCVTTRARSPGSGAATTACSAPATSCSRCRRSDRSLRSATSRCRWSVPRTCGSCRPTPTARSACRSTTVESC
ncbi:MAG: hypothetical protein R3C10_02700 [Pirellulales bacterium]